MMQTFEEKTTEVQFLSQPKDTFRVQGLPQEVQTVSSVSQFMFRLAVSNQSYTAQGTIRIRVSATLTTAFQSGAIDAQILAIFKTPFDVLKKQVRRNINFTSANPVGTTKSTDFITTVSDPALARINYIVNEVNGFARTSVAGSIEREKVITPPPPPPPTGTGRLQGIVILRDNHQFPFVLTESNITILRNRTDQLEIKEIRITNPSSELGTNSVQEIIAAIEAHLKGTVPPPPGTTGKRDIGISIIVATLLGVGIMGLAGKFKRGDKKK